MALTTTMASPTITSSSTLHTTKLSFAQSPLPKASNFFFFLSKTLLKPLRLDKNKAATTAVETRSPFSLLHASHRCFSSSVDNLEAVAADPLAETSEEDDEQEQPQVVEESSSEEERRLYVGNLPYTITDSELGQLFAQAGHVANVEVIYGRVTDRSRGFGFITMGSVEEANEAIRIFNGTEREGRTLRVNFPEVPKGGEREVMRRRIRNSHEGFIESPHKLYAGNLSWRLTSEGLRDAFANQRGIVSAKVIYERDTGRSRGFGFVSFESSDDAEAALDFMNGVEVEGRPLRLNLASDRARPSSGQQSSTGTNIESTTALVSIDA